MTGAGISNHVASVHIDVGALVGVDVDLVSVIVVNYNGMRFLQPCIDSLHKSFKLYRHELVIVDNCSTDGSREWLAKRSDIVFVPSPENLGFTGGNNLGAERASGGTLLFINNDTLVQSPLDPLIKELDRSDVGIVGCRLVYGDGRQQFSYGYDHTASRIVLSWLGFEKKYRLPTIFRRMETDPEKYSAAVDDVAWISGACFAIRRADWIRLGGFDTQFFMYCEDVDLCLRARQLGLRIRYIPNVLVTHYEGSGRIWIGAAAVRRTVNSYMLFSRKHHGRLASKGMSVFLGAVFLARALALRLLGIARQDEASVLKDKAAAYWAAGWRLWRHRPVPGMEGAHQ